MTTCRKKSALKPFLLIRTPDPDPDFLPIPDPGSRGQKGTGSRIRIRNTVLINYILKAGRVSILYFITEIWFLTQIIYSKETTT
jgi:hypothetical protein